MNPQLSLIRARYREGVIADNTARAYRHDWKVFQQWCVANGRESLPASTETVTFYLADLIATGRKISTAVRRTSGITFHHRQAGYRSPVTLECWKLLSGAQRLLHQQPRRVRALSLDDLRAISEKLWADGGPESIRNRAIIVLGFSTSLRRGSLADLLLSDVTFTPAGLVVWIRHEKTDQLGKGRQIAVALGKHLHTCASACLQDWLRIRHPGEGPLFTHVRTRGLHHLSGATIGRAVKLAVRSIGLDPTIYAGHSMRAGLVTTCINAGISDLKIAAHTGHRRLETLKIYHRQADDPFEGSPTGLIDL